MHTHTHTHGSLQCIPFIQWINNQFPEHQATQPTPSGTTCTMDLTAVMPSHIQPSANTFQCQPLPHLTSTHSFSSCPLPSFCVRIEMHILNFSSHNNQHHPVYTTNPPLTLNNNKNHPLYDTNQPFASHNTQSWPLYDTNFSSAPIHHLKNNNVNIWHNFLSPTPSLPQYLLSHPLPTLKEPSTPSSPTYIPILTGRLDWCPWSEALTMAVMGMNLFRHIAEDSEQDSEWDFDPGLVPTYPPICIHQNSLPEEIQAWNIWWAHDGQVLHLLVSQLSPIVCSQLPGAGSSQPQQCTVVLPSNWSDFEVTSIQFGNHATLCHFDTSKWVEVSLWWASKTAKNGRFETCEVCMLISKTRLLDTSLLFLIPSFLSFCFSAKTSPLQSPIFGYLWGGPILWFRVP